MSQNQCNRDWNNHKKSQQNKKLVLWKDE
jgi:hypothetical protein